MDNQESKDEKTDGADKSVTKYMKEKGYTDDSGLIITSSDIKYSLDISDQNAVLTFGSETTFREIAKAKKIKDSNFVACVDIYDNGADIETGEGWTDYMLAETIASEYGIEFTNDEPAYFSSDVNETDIDNLVSAVREFDKLVASDELTHMRTEVQKKMDDMDSYIKEQVINLMSQ